MRRWLLVMAAVTVLFAIVAVALGTFALARLAETRGVVLDEINPALRASKDLTIAVVNQESGVRGFGLTGREEFLVPYLSGLQAEQRAVDQLRGRAALGHTGDLLTDVDLVVAHMRTWRTEFAEPTIAATRSERPDRVVDPAVGKAQLDAARIAVTDLQSSLERRLAETTAELETASDFLRAVFVGIAIGLAALIIVVGVWLRRSVTTPLSRLAGEVRLVVDGDAHREVNGRGPREVVELAHDVDAMRRHILAELDALEQAHQRLDEQARDLERSNWDLEQFAYVASHDLQEPLRKVSSFCQLLQRRYGGQLDERADSYIEFAVDGARRMQSLINDLLAFSRVGRGTGGMAPVELSSVVAAAVGQLTVATEETGARITVGTLPVVLGEASLLTQLLANLVGNALKFRRPGIPPEVTVESQPHEDGWEICVTDNGIGVEPEYADKVFVIFQRLHARDDYPGTGIGLALAKKIVEFHGGRIWLDPDRDDGTTIRFTLPAAPAVSDLEEPVQ